jgi:hypothetical protein
MIVDIIRAFYRRSISFFAAWLLIITTQVLGYGWAGLMRKYVIEPAHMWWPGTLVQVFLFRVLHEKEEDQQPAEGAGRQRHGPSSSWWRSRAASCGTPCRGTSSRR